MYSPGQELISDIRYFRNKTKDYCCVISFLNKVIIGQRSVAEVNRNESIFFYTDKHLSALPLEVGKWFDMNTSALDIIIATHA